MSEFDDRLKDFQETQRASQELEGALYAARQQLKRVEIELDALSRLRGADDDALVERHDSLLAQARRLKAQIGGLQADREGLRGQLNERLVEFGRFSDPRERVSRLPDDFPFLLFPLRLETRFKTLDTQAGRKQQLWVRVYPDDCLVDTFEAALSESEIANARDYWAEIWRAGGSPDGQRGAWAALVNSHGSGRSAWIIQQVTPQGPASPPVKADPSDIVLVIATEAPPAGSEMDALEVYWQDYWLADGDLQKETAARNGLNAAVGVGRAAELIEAYPVFNLHDRPAPPKTKGEVALSLAWLVLPPLDQVNAKTAAWTEPPRARLLPDRFVLLAYQLGPDGRPVEPPLVTALGEPVLSPLIVGPDPSADPETQLKPEDGELKVSEDMRWLVDFDRAVQVGMGFRIDLTPEQARAGFDRLLVLGVRLDPGVEKNQAELQELLQHHFNSRKGLGIVRQGTPTNNTEQDPAGFTRSDDPDASFDDLFQPNDWIVGTGQWEDKRDGQWLAELLGIDLKVVQDIPNSSGRDVLEARCMNVALWPATMGYFLDTMLNTAVDDNALEQARWYFTRFVSGRGILPALRIGQQPYGLLPTTAYSRIRWLFDDRLQPLPGLDFPSGYRSFLQRLYSVLMKIDADWRPLLAQVSFVGKGASDPHQLLLDILGLHPASVEYYQRYAESADELTNRLRFFRSSGEMILEAVQTASLNLLRSFGFEGAEPPDILEKFFLRKPNRLKGPLIDDRPLSETLPIRAYTPDPDSWNYIHWLEQAARQSLDALHQQRGFIDDQPPKALLYLMLRHALIQSFRETSLRLELAAGLINEDQLLVRRAEPGFIHVEGRNQTSESRLAQFYRPQPAITDDEQMLMGEFIPTVIGKRVEARHLDELLQALECLREAPTARLERLLAEHVDLCSYRLDAWKAGLVHYQLMAMRYRRGEEERVDPRPGLYLGAYGWLEDVRPEFKVLSVVELEPELAEVFQRDGDPPLMEDPTNYGYIHAPSLAQAVTAAVLRNGYRSAASQENPSSLAVNLTSEQVRRALGVLEGIRNGQSLGALLGYQFERGLHDRHGLAEVDKFIFDLRLAFPLVVDPRPVAPQDDGASIQSIQARNVIDGLKLVEHIRQTKEEEYPFGKTLPDATDDEARVINGEVRRLQRLHDAVADLAVAEGVHQMLQGNYDRAAATLDAYGKANFPPEPEVALTPRSGLTLTQRVGLHLTPVPTPVAGPGVPPRQVAEPTLDAWLGETLPPLGQVVCKVEYFDAVQNGLEEDEISLAQLGLAPLDLLYVLAPEDHQAMSVLDDLIVQRVMNSHSVRVDAPITIHYTRRVAGKVTFFELAALVKSLRSVVLRSRPLRPTDLLLQGEAQPKADSSLQIDRARVASHMPLLDGLKTDLEAFHSLRETRLAALPASLPQVIANIDDDVSAFANLAARLARHGLPQTGFGFAYAARRSAAELLLQRVETLVDRWQGKLDRYTALKAEYAALPLSATDEERFALLQQAELEVSTSLTSPTPPTPNDLELAVQNKRDQLFNRRQSFEALLSINFNALSTLHSQAAGLLPVDAFDLEGLGLEEVEQAIVALLRDLAGRAKSLAEMLNQRLDGAQTLLDEHDAASDPAARLRSLTDAAHLLFSDDLTLIPEYDLPPAQGAELQGAWNDRGALLQHLRTVEKLQFPVDDWLHGLARVREKLHHWENLFLLAPAFGRDEPELTPLQLPYQAGDSWLALPFPAGMSIEGERLLYTAHFADDFDRNRRLCGLLVDEWSEVIPATDETTGLTFHFDRPNSEPPQAWLLVTPPEFNGAWQWRDLVDALNETLDMARLRAIEPGQIDGTPYAHFLPATASAVTTFPVTISLNLALNNEVHKFFRGT